MLATSAAGVVCGGHVDRVYVGLVSARCDTRRGFNGAHGPKTPHSFKSSAVLWRRRSALYARILGALLLGLISMFSTPPVMHFLFISYRTTQKGSIFLDAVEDRLCWLTG